MSSYDSYISALKSGVHKQKIKLELLRQDETPIENITSLIANTSGNLSVKRNNGVRRTVNFDIINLDNQYIPNIDSFYIHQKMQLFLGLELPDGTDYFLPQGIFILDDPSVSSNFSESLISIQAVDKFGLINGDLGGELGYVYIINVGTDISTAIKSILTLSGDPKAPIIDSALVGLTNPYTMTYQPSDTLGKIIVDLAQLYSASCYYNELGQMVVSKDVDDGIKSSLWDFTTEDDLSYQGAKNQYNWREMCNSCLVVGSNVNGPTVSYKASNTNLLSPTSIPNLNGFERIFYYQKDTLSTVLQCTDLANYILKYKTAVQNSVQINSIKLFHLNPDEIVTLTDEKLGLSDERFIINDYSLSLSTNGALSLNVIKSKEIPFI